MISPLLRFGLFEMSLWQAELSREGRLVKLQPQPFEVLRALVEQPGELVSREALRRRLWPSDVTVDFDQSLNKTIAKLRDALGDSAESPRFIQTVPKRGYRFIAPVTTSVAGHAPTDPLFPTSRVARSPNLWAWIGAAAAVGLAILALRRD